MQIKMYEEELLQDQLPWYFYAFFICQKIVLNNWTTLILISFLTENGG